MNKSFFFVCPLVLTVNACASLYQSPDKNEPHAQIIFEKGYKAEGDKIAIYAVEQSDTCNIDKQASIAKLGAIHNKPIIKRVPADQPISILATIQYWTTSLSNNVYGPVNLNVDEVCFSRVTFIPEKNKTYRAKLTEKSFRNCELSFVNESDGSLPSGADIVDGVACIEKRLSKE